MIDLTALQTLDKIALGPALLAGGVVIGMYFERSRLYSKFKAAAEANKQPAAAPPGAPAPGAA